MEQDIHIEDMQQSVMEYGRMRQKIEDTWKEIEKLKALMKVASAQLDFERAIEIREAIAELRKRMRS